MHHHHPRTTRSRDTSTHRAAFVITAVIAVLILAPIVALVAGFTVRVFEAVAGL